MKFIKWFKFPDKNVFEIQNTDKLSEVHIEVGDRVIAFNDNGTPYGICGAVWATQVDLSRQIEHKPTKMIEAPQ